MNYLFSFLTLFSFICQAQDFTLFEKKQFIGSKGDTLPYRILYPENYDRTRSYPLVVFLHGGGERGTDNEKQLANGVKVFLNESNRKKYPAIVIAPQCPSASYWASVKIDRSTTPLTLDFNYQYEITQGLRLAMELTHSLLKEEKADAKRVYITGLSMGGMGSLEAIYRNPDLFAAGAMVCGGGDEKAYTRRQTKTSFWLFHGDADVVIGVSNSREMYARLQELKAKVKYTEYPGVNHNSWDNAYAEPTLLEWMFSQHK